MKRAAAHEVWLIDSKDYSRLRRSPFGPVAFSDRSQRLCGLVEPPKAEPTDLQSVPFDRLGIPPQSSRALLGIEA